MRVGTFFLALGLLAAVLLSAKSSHADDGGSSDAAAAADATEDSAPLRAEAGQGDAIDAAADAAEAGIFPSKNTSGTCSLAADSSLRGDGSRAALCGLLAAGVLCVRRRKPTRGSRAS